MRKTMILSEKTVSWIALLVSITSAIFTYVQTSTTKAQLKLNELQIRPYVKYIPDFFEAKGEINVGLRIENLSPVPASVVYDEMTPWIDGVTSGINVHSVTQDFLYQHKGGVSSLPPITGGTAKHLMNGDSVLQIGVCVIYAPLSQSDSRRWEMTSLYEFVAGSVIPKTVFMQEVDVPASKNTCNSKAIRDLWLKTRSTIQSK